MALAWATHAAAQAVWDTRAPARAFVFRGKPIDPRCIEPMVGLSSDFKHPEIVDLARCTKKMTRKDPPARDTDGTFGSDKDGVFASDSMSDDPNDNAYTYYRVAARSGDLFALENEAGDGGTGRWFGVSLVRMSRGKVTLVEVLGSGDRCNGGASVDAAKGATLSWDINITPSDLIGLATGASGSVPDLPDSALSCVATQDMEYDLTVRKQRWVSVTLTGLSAIDTGSDSKLLDETADTDAHERCFNKLYNGYVRRNRLVLAPTMVKQFGVEYGRACLRKAR